MHLLITAKKRRFQLIVVDIRHCFCKGLLMEKNCTVMSLLWSYKSCNEETSLKSN